MNRFKAFWFARTFSYFGDFIFGITIIWFALEQGNVWEVAAVSSLSMIFRNLGSFLLAPSINYLGSRNMIVGSDFLRAVVNILLWLLVFTQSKTTEYTLVLVAVNSVIGGGFDAGMQAYVPTIVNDLRKANADLSSGRSTVQLLGYLTGGAMMQWYSGYGFLVNALTFVVAGSISYWVGGGEPSLHDKVMRKGIGEIFRKMLENWRLAWQALQNSATLRLAFWTTICANLLIIPALGLVAPLVKNEIGGGSLMFSIVQGALMIGGLSGATWVRRSKIKDGYMIAFGAFLCGLSGVLAGTSSVEVVLILTMLIYGVAQAAFNIAENTVIQQNEPHLRASIYAILQLSMLVLYPISSLTLAHFSTLTTIRIPFLICGTVMVLATIFFTWRWYLSEAGNKAGNQSSDQAEVPM